MPVPSRQRISLRIDCGGRHLLPGLIDAHTHLGLYDEGTGWAGNDANETIEPMTPHVRAFDGVYPLDPGFKDALKYGVTTVNVMPGSANVIGGTTSVIKTYRFEHQIHDRQEDIRTKDRIRGKSETNP